MSHYDKPISAARRGTCPFVAKYRPRVAAVEASTRERRRLKNAAVFALTRMQLAWVYDMTARYMKARDELMEAMKELGSPL